MTPQLRRAMPPWADRQAVEAFYVEARRLTALHGVRYVVDHIIPLAHPLVSGLHVPNNLQVILGVENSAKHNDYELGPGSRYGQRQTPSRMAQETADAIDTVRKGSTISQAARKHGIAVTTLRRALRRAGEPPRSPGRLPAQQ